MNQIQIIATIGPASETTETISSMIGAGMSAARLNLAHNTHDAHKTYVKNIRAVADACGVRVPIIQDLAGPRVKTDTGHSFDPKTGAITEKDREDLAALADCALEYVALSYVSHADDITALRELSSELGISPKIIAKIERTEALDALNKIIAVSDGIMVARGDLGDAVPVEQLPFVKKDILAACLEAEKPTIVATEMLTSMIDDTDPSRADISDIALAVLDGASATMLSEETAIGSYPIETVTVMRRVVDEAMRHAASENPARF